MLYQFVLFQYLRYSSSYHCVNGEHLWLIIDRYGGQFIGSRYGAGSGQIMLDNVRCNGTETDVANCQHDGWGSHNCRHRQDVSVSCSTGIIPVVASIFLFQALCSLWLCVKCEWNRLPTELKLLPSTDLFRHDLRTFLFHSVYGHQDTDGPLVF